MLGISVPVVAPVIGELESFPLAGNWTRHGGGLGLDRSTFAVPPKLSSASPEVGGYSVVVNAHLGSRRVNPFTPPDGFHLTAYLLRFVA